MGIYRLNGNFAVRLKALQLYIYWGALKGLNYIIVRLSAELQNSHLTAKFPFVVFIGIYYYHYLP